MADKYFPMVGDHVRAVVEGRVRYKFPRKLELGKSFIHDAEIVSVEKLFPKLPTTAGSLVRVRYRLVLNGTPFTYFMLDGDCGFWRSSDGGTWDARELADFCNRYAVEVIHDAGAGHDLPAHTPHKYSPFS